MVGTLDHEGVAARRARGGERRHRVGDLTIPRERGVGDRRHRIDRHAHGRTVTRFSG